MGILSQRNEYIYGKWFTFTYFQYSKVSETFSADPTAMLAPTGCVFHLEGGTAPNAAVTSASSTEATVTIGGSTAGTFGKILVITMSGETVGGVH